jgi:hypothetical protein
MLQYNSRIVLFLASVVLIVQVLGPLLGLMLGSLPVEEVLTLSLSKLVDFGTGKACEQLLGKCVRNRLAYKARRRVSLCIFQASNMDLDVNYHQHVGGPRRP